MKKVTRDAVASATAASTRASKVRKSDRLQLRLTEQQKNLLSRAALVENTNMSGFIVQKSCEAAERVLNAHNRFLVDAVTWKKVTQALEEPARDLPAVRDLLNKRTVLDD